jgi:two-component system cell cycle sensor histidine kinase/response regulator CckA
MAKANILIVEDEAIIASVIAGALKKFDFGVQEILNSGEAAVAAALRGKPDLILMDIRLQGAMDGISAVERIQEQLDIPIIYLTAYADESTLERAKKTKPYGYIPKPFQEIELRTTIEMALYKHGFEVQLKESEARFRSLFENSQDVIYIADKNGDLLEMNPSGLSLFGYAREEILGTSSSRLYVDPHDHKKFISRIKIKKTLKNVELKLQNKRGELIYSLETANIMVDKDGKMSGFQGIIRDITESKKREETLILLQTAIDASSEAVLITDSTGTIVYGNPAVETMTGYEVLEIVGRKVESLGSGVAKDEKDKQLWKTIMAGSSWMGEFLNQRKDGTTYYQRAMISPVRDNEGKISHFVSIAADITMEKKLAEQMIQAAKMDSLGRLASGIAHDFNNYLTLINGYSEVLLYENAQNENSERLRIILQAGQNASKLVGKILGFSRRQQALPTVVDINCLLKDLEKMVRRLLGESIELEIDLHSDVGNIFIDAAQIEQVLINMVINARDAMPGGGRLTLASLPMHVDEVLAADHPGLRPGEYGAIRVGDSGMGMNAEVLARIFDPFFTTKPKGEGTGLGLALVFGIIGQNGGTVWAESEPGKGSTFHLLLPRTDAIAVQDSEVAAEERFDGRSAILVEDESDIRELMHEIIESLGMKVYEFENGEKALAAAEKMKHLDLLFCDIGLPGLSGIEVANRIRKLHPETAIIFNSGHNEDYLKRAGLEQADMHFVEKPSSRATIVKKIRELLG